MGTIHILPTDKPSRLHTDSREFFLTPKYQIGKEINSIVESRNIYITSDETIKEGDWVLNPIYKTVYQWLTNADIIFDRIDAKKIILTTDQDLILDGVQAIDDEFLEWFVKNPSCEEVEVEMNQGRYYDYGGNVHITNAYKIIIPQEEEFKNSNNLQGSIIDSSTENNSFYLPKEKRVMVKFNDDEPMHINSIYGIGNFIISLKEGENIKFQNNGKTFELYIETT
jgi:hypothetical protein